MFLSTNLFHGQTLRERNREKGREGYGDAGMLMAHPTVAVLRKARLLTIDLTLLGGIKRD